jgi:hypothetical protein
MRKINETFTNLSQFWIKILKNHNSACFPRSSNSYYVVHLGPPGPPAPMFHRVLQIVLVLQLMSFSSSRCSRFSKSSRSSNSHVPQGSPGRPGPPAHVILVIQVLLVLFVLLASLQFSRVFMSSNSSKVAGITCPPSLRFSFPPVHPSPPILCF